MNCEQNGTNMSRILDIESDIVFFRKVDGSGDVGFLSGINNVLGIVALSAGCRRIAGWITAVVRELEAAYKPRVFDNKGLSPINRKQGFTCYFVIMAAAL